MDKDKISTFTLRIASSNGSELISILFDIYSEYEKEALKAIKAGDKDKTLKCLKKCSEVVSHLQKDLNFHYSLSNDLYSLYDYVQRALAKSVYKADAVGLMEAKPVMDKLSEAFTEIAATDKSEPIMKNTQKVFAGFTYGRTSLNESLAGNQSSRGFWA